MSDPVPDWAPAYPTWTPCEDRPDPAAWVGVYDGPYDGPYHDPDAEEPGAD